MTVLCSHEPDVGHHVPESALGIYNHDIVYNNVVVSSYCVLGIIQHCLWFPKCIALGRCIHVLCSLCHRLFQISFTIVRHLLMHKILYRSSKFKVPPTLYSGVVSVLFHSTD